MPTRRPSIQIDAVVGVVNSRRRPVGTAARRGAGATGGTAVGGRAAAAGPAESELAPRAGAGAPDGRPSSHAAPTATRPTAVSAARRMLAVGRRGGAGVGGRAPIARVGMSASGGQAGGRVFFSGGALTQRCTG